MPRLRVLSTGGLLIAGAALATFNLRQSADPAPKVVAAVERSPICPWRDPDRDLRLLFPEATMRVADTRVVSGVMSDLQRKLGRPLEPDENPLRIFRARTAESQLGSVVVRRVKGEHGGIEIVTAVDRHGRVAGVLIQSHREPARIASTITNASWLGSFRGKTADAQVRTGEDLPQVAVEAQTSARAIAEGVRAQLLVLRAAETAPQPRGIEGQANH